MTKEVPAPSEVSLRETSAETCPKAGRFQNAPPDFFRVQKELVCIICPNSCRLTVTHTQDGTQVTGASCKRGIQHGIDEVTNPMRMITSTVAVTGGILPRLPVIGSGEVPKAKLAECLAKIYRTKAAAPVMYGEVIISNICGTGVDIIASRPIAAGGRT